MSNVETAPAPVATAACQTCPGSTGFVRLATGEAAFAVLPCPECRPEAWRLALAGVEEDR